MTCHPVNGLQGSAMSVKARRDEQYMVIQLRWNQRSDVVPHPDPPGAPRTSGRSQEHVQLRVVERSQHPFVVELVVPPVGLVRAGGLGKRITNSRPKFKMRMTLVPSNRWMLRSDRPTQECPQTGTIVLQ